MSYTADWSGKQSQSIPEEHYNQLAEKAESFLATSSIPHIIDVVVVDFNIERKKG